MDETRDRDTERDKDDELRYQIGKQIQKEIKKDIKPSKTDSKRYNEGLHGEPREQVKVVRIEEEHMEMKDWLILLFLAGVPILGWIVLFYGIYSDDSTKEKVRFCKACLIYQAVILLAGLFFIVPRFEAVTAIVHYFLKII